MPIIPPWWPKEAADNERRRIIRRYHSSKDVDVTGTTQTTAGGAIDNGAAAGGNQRWPGIVMSTLGPNEFAEVDEFFNQDWFGYVGGVDAGDSMWGFPNYFSTIARYNNPPFAISANTFFGMSWGKLMRPNPTADFNEVSCGIRYNLNSAVWEAWVNNKWASPGNRFFLVNLGADGRVGAAAPDTQQQHRLEMIYLPNDRISFLINGKMALDFTDGLVAPQTPLRQIYENKNNLGETLAGLVLVAKQGGGALGTISVMFQDTQAETLVDET